MSYIEISGTVFNLWAVWLSTRENIWTWPVSIVAVTLFGILFYQIQLYSDLIEQVYYLLTGFYGWWLWAHKDPKLPRKNVRISHITWAWGAVSAVTVGVGTLGLGALMARIHEIWPQVFKEPASFPYIDAFTTVLSFVGQLYVAYKKIECWWIWMVVNSIGIVFYAVKGVWWVAGLCVVFLGMSFYGYAHWRKLQKLQALSMLR